MKPSFILVKALDLLLLSLLFISEFLKKLYDRFCYCHRALNIYTFRLINHILKSIIYEIGTYLLSEAATGGVLYKKVFLKISQYSEENTTLLKRDSDTGVFL